MKSSPSYTLHSKSFFPFCPNLATKFPEYPFFPLTSWFAFLFLAFSEDSRDEGAKVHVETMTLQTVCSSGTRYWKRVLWQGEQHIVA